MAEERIKWTEQQRRAITAAGGDILVTASAGTGKTSVLSGRCVNTVSAKDICPDVWSVLVVTFTDAAAEQMRSRIAEQLRAAYREKRDRHLHHQLILLQGADISTIHSFCKRLITAYFYKLGIDPTFRVIDEDEQKLLKAEVLEKTIEWAWQQSNLQAALAELLYRRDLRISEGFAGRIIEISNFLDGVVWREGWYERARLLAEAAGPFATELAEKQKEVVGERLGRILAQLRHSQKIYRAAGGEEDWAGKCEDTFVRPIEKSIELLKAGDWAKCSEEIRNFKKPRVNRPKGVAEDIGVFIQKTVKNAVDKFAALSELAILNPDYLERIGGSVNKQTRVLVELVKKFDQLYSEAKRAVNCMDFADLEHYGLRLLSEEGSLEDKPAPSETALALRRRYKYIFVDEYQDINTVQKTIIDMLSGGGNVFVVGDVKQSIYAWRGAKPEIFLERLKGASTDKEDSTGGLRVDLNVNFRSAGGILDFVNKVFGRIMTASFSKIDYDDSAKLRPASESKSQKPGGDKAVVEFYILDEQKKDEQQQDFTEGENQSVDSEWVSWRQRQAAMIARRIKQMVSGESGCSEFQIYDRDADCLRDVEYRDIVILMRSPAKRVNDYVEVLRLAGVPVSCEASAGYFEATEISDLLCLLKVLDNPQRDIELAAVLRSPFFKISDNELAKIRLHCRAERRMNFYNCIVEYCESGPDAELAAKLEGILIRVEQWRTTARRGDLADLIWQIYRQTGFLSFVSALPNGQWRRANLLKLHDKAIEFEGFASSGVVVSLRRFVEFIERLQAAGRDWATAEPEASAENAVRIMSIHKSKGLEFPVVFLAELGSKFNKRDAQGDCLFDVVDTLGLQVIDRQSNTRLSSLAHEVIAEQKLSAALEEEERILYVAMTRARDRLVLSACEKKKRCQDIVRNGFFFGAESIADWQLRRCQNPLEWILYGLSEQKNLHSALESELAAKAVDDDLFSIKVYGQRELEKLSGYIRELKSKKSGRFARAAKKLQPRKAEGELVVKVKESLGWRYRFSEVSKLRAKESVTRLTHRSDEWVRIDYSRALDRKPRAVLSADLARHRRVDSRLVGAATHLVISKLDLVRHRRITKEAVEKIKEKLLADGAVAEGVAEHINTELIIGFFESELGREVFDSENKVWREWPFTFALPASFVARDSSLVARDSSLVARVTDGETVIVQGIIDMLVLRRTPDGGTPEGLLVIDFKTDSITAEGAVERAEVYREQLEFYSRAAGAILKSKILGKWLYFLTPGCAIEIKN